MASSSSVITEGVLVEVLAEYVPDHSSPEQNNYFFIYHVLITNQGDEPAKLITRHWVITNAHGEEEHVRGPGVVGETPRLEPGQSFRYTSACPLETPVGAMRGTYHMVRDDGRMFDAEVGVFTLAVPHTLN